MTDDKFQVALTMSPEKIEAYHFSMRELKNHLIELDKKVQEVGRTISEMTNALELNRVEEKDEFPILSMGETERYYCNVSTCTNEIASDNLSFCHDHRN